MVTAHGWDLGGAQDLGPRSAYVARLVGAPPTVTDTFDLHAEDLAGLADHASRRGAGDREVKVRVL